MSKTVFRIGIYTPTPADIEDAHRHSETHLRRSYGNEKCCKPAISQAPLSFVPHKSKSRHALSTVNQFSRC
ncbi:MAG: hypothetical protein ACI30M_05495, partial [Muribaculaceae bacterium]